MNKNSALITAFLLVWVSPFFIGSAFAIEPPGRGAPGALQGKVLIAQAGPDDEEGSAGDAALITAARTSIERGETRKAGKALERLIEDFPSSRFIHEARYLTALVKYYSGDAGAAKEILLGLVSGDAVPVGIIGKAEGLLKEIDDDYRRAAKREEAPAIGALVPLGGAYLEYGNSALRGILLASGVFGPEDPAGKLSEVFVEDAGPDPARAEAAAEKLSENPEVVALVGPFFSSTLEKAASVAQRKAVPLVTVSQKDVLAGEDGYLFRNTLSPSSQAAKVARHAYYRSGARRFAILYPQNQYGTILSDAFRAEIQRLGASVVAEASYREATTDFSREIKYLFGITVKEKKEGRKTVKEFKAGVQADALYIPDNYGEVVLILPYLDYFGIKGIRLLGSNGWNFPALVSEAGKEAEGAVFADSFFAGSRRPGTAEFTGRFTAAYGKTPGVLEAQSYDSAAVVITSIVERPGEEGGLAGFFSGSEIVEKREALKKRLRERKDFVGASGPLSFDVTGEAVRRPFLLTVKDSQIIEIEDAP